jgi:hypothetical protein
VTPHDWGRVSPFGHPRITARLTAPRGLSQPPTSFIGSWCQGIHHAPLITWPQRCSRPLCNSQTTNGTSPHTHHPPHHPDTPPEGDTPDQQRQFGGQTGPRHPSKPPPPTPPPQQRRDDIEATGGRGACSLRTQQCASEPPPPRTRPRSPPPTPTEGGRRHSHRSSPGSTSGRPAGPAAL